MALRWPRAISTKPSRLTLTGHWASANSQIRSFLEGLLDAIAERIDPSAAALPSGQSRRTKLAEHNFLSRELNEWSDQGFGFINGLVKRLHPHGSHPAFPMKTTALFGVTPSCSRRARFW